MISSGLNDTIKLYNNYSNEHFTGDKLIVMWSLFDKGNVHIHDIQTYLHLQATDDTDANGSIIYETVIVIKLFFLC